MRWLSLLITEERGKLQEDEQQHLGDDDAQEHAQGIDCGIGHRGTVTAQGIVGIVHGHGVGHRAAEHAAHGRIVDVCQPQRDPAHQQHGNYREQETGAHPQQAFRPDDGGKEIGSRRQS